MRQVVQLPRVIACCTVNKTLNYAQYVLSFSFYGHHIHVFQVRKGDTKIPGTVEKKYLKYSYNFGTLVPFKVVPLLLDTAISGPHPLLETMSTILRCVIPVVCRINQNVMCIQHVVKHNLVLDGMLIY